MNRAVLDTYLYITWLNTGAREGLVLGPGLVRHMSTVVLMARDIGATVFTNDASDYDAIRKVIDFSLAVV